MSKNDEIKRDLQTCRVDIPLNKIVLAGRHALKYKLLREDMQNDIFLAPCDDDLIVGSLVMYALDKIDIIDYLAEKN